MGELSTQSSFSPLSIWFELYCVFSPFFSRKCISPTHTAFVCSLKSAPWVGCVCVFVCFCACVFCWAGKVRIVSFALRVLERKESKRSSHVLLWEGTRDPGRQPAWAR